MQDALLEIHTMVTAVYKIIELKIIITLNITNMQCFTGSSVCTECENLISGA